jgi:hypothetical protein
MGFNGSGSFSIEAAGNPVVGDTVIDPTSFNATMTEIAAGLSGCITKDGQTTITANLPMNSKKLTGLTAGIALTDSVNLSNLIANTGVYVSTVAGTVDAITLTPSPTHTTYNPGVEFFFIAAGDNTGAVTVNVSGLGVKNVMKMGAVALVAGEIVSGSMVHIIYDGTQFLLLTPPVHQGNWTPSVGGTATYTTQVGRWTKIGRLVHIYGHLVINLIGTGSTSTISGLPFTALNNGVDPPLHVSDFTSLATNVVWIGARVNVNATTVTLRNLTAAGASATSSALFGNSTAVTFGGAYYI